ncbi:peptide synthetase [Nocardia sp. NPDC057227]|uniref:peptide synthetase n=1 Tax=Nocardia sp. NPDC057227 TaxID=3346056 RepID=UPI003637E625
MTVLTDTRLELVRRRLAAAGLAGDHRFAAPALPRLDTGEFGIAERRMWKIYELDPDSLSHTIGLILRFDGSYTVPGLVEAVELVVREAAVLGSLVTVDGSGVPRRVPGDTAGEWIAPGAEWAWNATAATADELVAIPFRLTEEPPLRVRVTADGDGVTVLFVVHHLAVDDTSWPLLLGTLISGTWPDAAAVPPIRRPAPQVQRAVEHATRTWAADGIRFPLSGELPRVTPAESWLAPMDEDAGAKLTEPVDPAAVAALDAVARELGGTANALFIAVTALGVHALTGADDHVLLVPADNRQPGDRPDRVGYSGNIVPMRFAVDPAATVRETLRAAVAVVYRAMEFAGVDYGTVLTALRTAGGRFPVAEIMASVRTAPLRGIPVPDGARVTCESVFTGIAPYPLTFAFELAPDGRVHLEVDHQLGTVDAAFARRAAALLTALVARVPAALDGTVAALARELTEPNRETRTPRVS